ncbi:Zinc-finger associated domain (zf-AD) [Popillia japonica]|uniref:Zinc-finger associated domain (Zf-AD) n=1 Tax=Popillia japonica TaxID=7064 RepID=A0AAW1MGH2_POPJA
MGTESEDMKEIKQHGNNRAIKNGKLRIKIEAQEKRLEIVEKQIRRNNIVIQGIEDGGNDNVKDKVKELFTRIGADVKIEKDITEIIRLGPYNPAKKRAVLVKLNGWEQKMKIYNQTKKLKGSNIWINDDFSRKVIQDRKELIPRSKEARDKEVPAEGDKDEFQNNVKLYRHIKTQSRKSTTINIEDQEWDRHIKTQSRKSTTINIEDQEWEKHFSTLLRRTDEEMINHPERRNTANVLDETKISTEEEFNKILSTLKCNKTAGPDTIVNEMIEYGGDALKQALLELMNFWTARTKAILQGAGDSVMLDSILNRGFRICLEKGHKLMPIFDPIKPRHFSILIMACASVQVIEGDGLPPYICHRCISRLNIAYQFKSQCESSDAKMRQCFDNLRHMPPTPDLTGFIQIKKDNFEQTCESEENGVKCTTTQITPVDEIQQVVQQACENAEDKTESLENNHMHVLQAVQLDPDSSIQNTEKSNTLPDLKLELNEADDLELKVQDILNSVVNQKPKKQTKPHQCDTCGKVFRTKPGGNLNWSDIFYFQEMKVNILFMMTHTL